MTRLLILGLFLIGSALTEPQNYDANPFLNGYSNDVQQFLADQSNQYRVDVDNNVFLQHAVAGRAIDSFNAPGYLPPKETIQCNGPQQCVRKDLCRNGFFADKSAGNKKECSSDSEVCCMYRPPPPTPPPSIPCTARNFICVSPAQCSNGVIKSNGYGSPQKLSDKCFAPEVCCRVEEQPSTKLTNEGYVVRVPEKPFNPPSAVPTYLPPDRVPESSINYPKRVPARGEGQLSLPIPRPNTLAENLPPVKCAAALNCTEPQFCSSTGFITKTPVVLTKEQELFRVPLTECRDLSKGIVGKCCRDPDYVDPWPTSLSDTGKYDKNVFDPTTPRSPVFGAQLSEPIGACFEYKSYKPDLNSIDTKFKDYPWQAMVLLESSKSILCSGSIIGQNVIATSASCVGRHAPHDIVVKVGEWKLGSDEEDLPFQLVHAKNIEIHPGFEPSSLKNDMALIYLDSKIQFNQHVQPICYDEADPLPTEDCRTTGWGKSAIKIHAQGAVMHHTGVTPLPAKECEKVSEGYNYSPPGGSSHIVCGAPTFDACELDVGSALACISPNGPAIMRGTYSTESQCGSSPSQTVTFEKPDVKWMKDSINRFNRSNRY